MRRDFRVVRQLDGRAINAFQEETMPGARIEILIEMGNRLIVEQDEGLMFDFFSGLAESDLGDNLPGNRGSGDDFEKFVKLRLIGAF